MNDEALSRVDEMGDDCRHLGSAPLREPSEAAIKAAEQKWARLSIREREAFAKAHGYTDTGAWSAMDPAQLAFICQELQALGRVDGPAPAPQPPAPGRSEAAAPAALHEGASPRAVQLGDAGPASVEPTPLPTPATGEPYIEELADWADDQADEERKREREARPGGIERHAAKHRAECFEAIAAILYARNRALGVAAPPDAERLAAMLDENAAHCLNESVRRDYHTVAAWLRGPR